MGRNFAKPKPTSRLSPLLLILFLTTFLSQEVCIFYSA